MRQVRCGGAAVEWRPSAVTALAASPDHGSRVAAARADGSLELWLVSPGSVGWHCQLTIQGDASVQLTSLVWSSSSSPKADDLGRLLSSSIDGTVSEWDLFHLRQNIVLESVGTSIWQMALEPSPDSGNDFDKESSGIEDGSDDDLVEPTSFCSSSEFQRLALACDDGSVRLYSVPVAGDLNYFRSLPRVSGKTLSVTWSRDSKFIFSGSSDGLIRCWNANTLNEVYRITAGLGCVDNSSEICIWSLLSLGCGTLVSGDSTGSVQFWDGRLGAHLQAHTYHTGDVNALAAVDGHNMVFSAGSDGQVIFYKLSGDASHASEKLTMSKDTMAKWSYVTYVRAHTHDIRALVIAFPITKQDQILDEVKRIRRKEKPIESSYRKWAQIGVPMLISSGDDTKLFAYSANEFTLYTPHDICPAPQRPIVSLAGDKNADGTSMILLQSSSTLDVLLVKAQNSNEASTTSGKTVTQLLARIKSKGARKIICSSISNNAGFFAYSDFVKPCLFRLSRHKGKWGLDKINLPKRLPQAHSIVFSVDSSNLILAGHDRKIYVVDVNSAEIVCTYAPQRNLADEKPSVVEPPITKLFPSPDGQWLAAINCFGDIYIFNLELQRQHWYIYRMNDASVTAGGFSPGHRNMLVIATSLNEVYVFDVEAKQLSEWSRKHTHRLPPQFQEFPGEVIGLTFPRCSHSSTSIIVYSSRAMCSFDFLKNLKITGKRKLEEDLSKKESKNFDILRFKDPVFYIGNLSESSVLIVEKSWGEVVELFGAPVHRHIFGT